jgi:NAD(P)-dependent dehydrogenase (short-subunit alcohol dehydrogenase family)
MELSDKYLRYEFDFSERTLAGKVILLPGGAGGLGSALMALLLREGAIPVVGYRRNRERAERFKKALMEKYGGTLYLIEGDINEAKARSKYLQAAAEVTGEVYGLVNFVGDPARVKEEALSDEDMLHSLKTNYVGPVLLAQLIAAHMRAKGIEGSIVFISSMQGIAPFEGSLNYGVPKAALVHAARIFARQWGGKSNIRVNVVAPGVNVVGMAAASIAQGKYDSYIKNDVIKRFGCPEDVARVVRLLLEPDNYITGQVIVVDGGLTIRR